MVDEYVEDFNSDYSTLTLEKIVKNKVKFINNLHSLFSFYKEEKELSDNMERVDEDEKKLDDILQNVIKTVIELKKEVQEKERDLKSIDLNDTSVNASINRKHLSIELDTKTKELASAQKNYNSINDAIRSKQTESLNLETLYNEIDLKKENVLKSLEITIAESVNDYRKSIENSYDTHVFNGTVSEVAKLIFRYKKSYLGIDDKYKNESELNKTIHLIQKNLIKSKYENGANTFNGDASLRLLNGYNLFKENNNNEELFEVLEEYAVITTEEYENLMLHYK